MLVVWPSAGDVVVCGEGFDRVFADGKDVVAADCERVYIDAPFEDFLASIPQSYWEGLLTF